jgi:hypothetical protein
MRFLKQLFACPAVRRARASFRPAVEQLEEHLALSQLVAGGRGEVYFTDNRHVYRYTDARVLQDLRSPLARSNTSGLSVGTSVYLLAADNAVWRYDGAWQSITWPTAGPQNVKSLVAGQRHAYAFDGSDQLWVFTETRPFSGGGYWTRTAAYGHDMSLGTDSGGNDELWFQDFTDRGAGYGVWRYDRTALHDTGFHAAQVFAGQAQAFAFTRSGVLLRAYAYDRTGDGPLVWESAQISDGRSSGHEFALYMDRASQTDTVWMKDANGMLWRVQQDPHNLSGPLSHMQEGQTALTGLQAGNGTVYGVMPGSSHIYAHSASRTWDTRLSATAGFVVGTPLAETGVNEVWAVSVELHWSALGFAYSQQELSYYADGFGQIYHTGVAAY